MINLLIINQHGANHGDEAALRGMLERLGAEQYNISIIYNVSNEESTFNLDQPISEAVFWRPRALIEKVVMLLALILPLSVVRMIATSKLKRVLTLYSNADLIISSPSGANLGLYRDWKYLWRIYIAQKIKKKIAIYSISCGPFSPNSILDFLTQKILKRVDFLSLRDARSYSYCKKIGVDFIESVDTAYLSSYGKSLPDSTLAHVGIPFRKEDYIVFVPNELNRWHPSFRMVPGKLIERFYRDLLFFMLESGANIVFLPQLFGSENDSEYFQLLIAGVDARFLSKIYVVNESYDSNIQQKIISLSKGVVGARYHSIVFSINNDRPFLCLSYEHKMENMLEVLHLQKRMIILKDVFDGQDIEMYKAKAFDAIQRIVCADMGCADIDSRIPKRIAEECFEKFKKNFLLKKA